MFILSAAAGAESTTMLPTILMVAVMMAVMYFMLIRPENKKKKAAEELRSGLKVGDVITTIGGIVGTICHTSLIIKMMKLSTF